MVDGLPLIRIILQVAAKQKVGSLPSVLKNLMITLQRILKLQKEKEQTCQKILQEQGKVIKIM